MSLTRIGILLAASAVLAQSQTAGAAPPRFEVASVKPSGAQSVRGSDGGPGSSDPDRYSFNSATLLDLLVVAYNVEVFQISSKTPLEREHFDVAAKLPAGSSRQQFRAMMQNLLEERFRLKLHVQSREFPAYELVVAKTGLKMKDSTAGTGASPPEAARSPKADGFPDLPPNRPAMSSVQSMSGGYEVIRLKAQQEPISVLARFIRSRDDRPIVDKTGLTGKYDFTLEFTRDLPSAANDPQAPPVAPILPIALQRQLGLQLIDKKVAFDVLVIDSFDKMPSEN